MVEFDVVVVPAKAVKCRIVIPASTPQTKQRGFFIFGPQFRRETTAKHMVVRATVPFLIPAQLNANLSRLFPALRSSVKNFELVVAGLGDRRGWACSPQASS